MRTYKRKTNRGTTPRETYMEAAKVLAKTSSLRKASATYSINFMTIRRFCKITRSRKWWCYKFLAFNLEVKINRMDCEALLFTVVLNH
jgi:hypothetical protein